MCVYVTEVLYKREPGVTVVKLPGERGIESGHRIGHADPDLLVQRTLSTVRVTEDVPLFEQCLQFRILTKYLLICARDTLQANN